MSDEGSWSDYVSEAGTDPGPLDVVADALADAASAVGTAIEQIDSTLLPDGMATTVEDGAFDAGEAASWSSWGQSDLRDAASWQDDAADHVAAAQEALAGGSVEGFEAEMAAAQTAMDISADVTDQASTDLGIGADYMDASSAAVDTTTLDTSAYETDAVDTTSYDGATYDSGSYDTTTIDVSSDA